MAFSVENEAILHSELTIKLAIEPQEEANIVGDLRLQVAASASPFEKED